MVHRYRERIRHERPFSAHKVIMNHISPFNNDDYSVVVKHRAPLPNSWRWEIYRAGRASHMECSEVFFCTVSAAHRAGKAALRHFMATRFPERVPDSPNGPALDDGHIAPNAILLSNVRGQGIVAATPLAQLSSFVSEPRPASVIRDRRTRSFAPDGGTPQAPQPPLSRLEAPLPRWRGFSVQ